MIAPKLYARMTDMAEDVFQAWKSFNPDWRKLDLECVNFQDTIGWPWKASQSQLDDWNSKRLYQFD